MTNKIKLTGLWKQETRDGQDYLSGQMLPGAKLLIFPNSYKNKPGDPDFVCYLAATNKENGNGDSNGF